ncbi:sigma-70 family RNA polymerase sigma factor [Nocardioides anomalus]|uniref:Sigma-70 family RNA polymerase sigma factor n=1 Tax=Nocardioides anomalus TaxID=2712223 RepID=A0A6G6WGT1_9ACTN|nr:RNA polymerase subunit sigma-70 [Nocardioides anomalus]QIG44419.1 sigma-70 family RNA polymerase sigma factor [Nocardioides anomalus]
MDTSDLPPAADPEQLLARARAGDGAAFDALVAPYRTELLAHCYRMLGSFQDAEDALQESLLSAWSGLGGFQQRASLRTWLYQVTTNRCLNVRRATQRRRAKEWDVPGLQPPSPSRSDEVVWLEPLPPWVTDSLTAAAPDVLHEARESVSLAFVTALQRLPPRQVAVLVLRDVLGFPAAEVAAMLATSVESVTSALKRARAGMRSASRDVAPEPGSAAEEAVTARFARAYEAGDVDALVAMLTDDVFVTMPPMPLEYEGRDLCGEFLALFFAAGRRYRMVPTRANGQPAFGMYLRGADGSAHASGFLVLGLEGAAVSRLTRFETGVLSWFGLPRTLAPPP